MMSWSGRSDKPRPHALGGVLHQQAHARQDLRTSPLKLLIQLVASSWFNHVLMLTKVAMPISKCVGLLVKNTNKGEGDRLLPGLAIDVTRQVSNNAIVVKKKESHF